MEKKDLLVIGSGPGGYVAAIRAAQLGFKTAVVERAEIGGICLNWGCIPTKALLHSATLYHEMKDAAAYGVTSEKVSIDFPQMVKHSRTVAAKLSKGIEFLFRKNQIEVVPGTAKIVGPTSVQVLDAQGKSQVLESDRILIATGARPRAIPGIEFDASKIISSKEAMTLTKLPQSLAIIGAGAIGVEFAYFYATLGTQVTLIEMMPQILPIEDSEVAQVVTTAFKKKGIRILTETKVDKIKKNKDGVQVLVSSKEGTTQIDGELALVAIGVQGNVENLGLEEVGVKVERGAIQVDKTSYQTAVPTIYAIGDVIGPPWLAHVASAEGIAAVENMAKQNPHPIDYQSIPGCTYCQPQVASIGLTEAKARELGREIKVGKFPFRANGKALAMGHVDGFAKLIFDAQYGELLGAHIVGAEATEMLAELGLAKTLEATADEIMQTIHAHPTVSEVIKEATEEAFGRPLHI
jgi:dihydrolipoamide dehydrogenase